MSVLETKSRMTGRYQTTIPAEIRRVLGLGKGDELGYVVAGSGKVTLVNLSSMSEPAGDPALAPFLAMIEDDLRQRPETVVPSRTEQAQADLAFLARRKARRG